MEVARTEQDMHGSLGGSEMETGEGERAERGPRVSIEWAWDVGGRLGLSEGAGCSVQGCDLRSAMIMSCGMPRQCA